MTKLATILADFTTTLSTEIAIGGTTATLSSATDDDSVALPSGRYFFTLDNSTSSKEHISCDLVGTALTNIKSLSRQGVETTGTVRKHRIGASVTLTDFGHIKFINDLVSGATTLNSSAPLGYDGAPSSLTGNQLATVTYVLGVVNGGAVTFDQQIISNQTSGEALAINDLVYFKEADARWYKVDADLTATFDGLQTGINKTTAGASGVTIQVAISGPVSGFTGLTAGSKYYASNTAGSITTTAGTYSVFVGWALTTTTLLFNAEGKTLPTQKEKDALVGSQGVPTSTNKYVTQDNTTASGTDQSQTTQNGTVETGEADATTKKNKLAQSFIPAKTKIRGVNLWKIADTGTFTGTVTVSLQADTTGSPSGTPLATQTITNIAWLAKAVGDFEVLFTSEYASLTQGSLYWIVIETSTSDSSNHPNLGTNTAGGYSSGSAKYKNTTDGWVAIATIDLYFKTLEGNNSQAVVTNTSGKIDADFYSISEMPTPAFQQLLPTPYTTADPSGSSVFNCYGSTQDGSVMYTIQDYSVGSFLSRYVRSSTGVYEQTHSETVILANLGGGQGNIIVIGSYIYLFYRESGGSTVASYRYSADDCTGSTAMTEPVLSATSSVVAWTDGTYAYVMSLSASSTTYNKWSVSGTTWSAVTTGTLAAAVQASQSQVMYDGTNLYIMYASSGSLFGGFTIRKFSDLVGTSLTSTTTKYINKSANGNKGIGDNIGMPLLLNLDTTRMYYGYTGQVYNQTTVYGSVTTLIPIAKP